MAEKRALFSDLLLRLFYPNACLIQESFRNGRLPFWNPHIYGGVPFLANMQSAVLYPASLLYACLPFPSALACLQIIHSFLAAASMAALAADTGLSAPASLLAGIVYAFNGYATLHYSAPSNFDSYAWMPLVLMLLGRAWRPGPSLRYAAAAGAAWALEILAGHPQFAFYTGLAGVVLAGMDLPASSARPCAARRMGLFIAAAAAAAMLSAVLWLPAAQLAASSPMSAELGYDWATSYSLPPWDALRMLVVPLWAGAFSPQGDPSVVGFYFGWVAAVFAFWSLRADRGRIRGPALLAGIGVAMALGRHLPGYHLLYKLLPPLRLFRFPAQALCLACLGFARLSGEGLEEILRRGILRPRAAFLLILAVFAEYDLFAARAVQTIDASLYAYRSPVAEFIKARGGFGRVMMTPRTRAALRRGGASQMAAWRGFRDSLLPNLAAAEGLDDADGFEVMRFASYDRVLSRIDADPRSEWLNLLDVRYLLTFWDLPADQFTLSRSWGPLRLYENTKALARARIEGACGRAIIRSYESDRVLVETTAQSPGRLILADVAAPGWRAIVNGVPAAIVPYKETLRSLGVPAGKTLVEFRYRPPHFVVAASLSAAGWLLLAALWGASVLRRRRRDD